MKTHFHTQQLFSNNPELTSGCVLSRFQIHVLLSFISLKVNFIAYFNSFITIEVIYLLQGNVQECGERDVRVGLPGADILPHQSVQPASDYSRCFRLPCPAPGVGVGKQTVAPRLGASTSLRHPASIRGEQ